jgi:hypothetical protein
VKKLANHLKGPYAAAIKQRWDVRHTGKGHIRWKSPNGPIVFTSGNSRVRSFRTMENELSNLRKAGLLI